MKSFNEMIYALGLFHLFGLWLIVGTSKIHLDVNPGFLLPLAVCTD